MNSGPEGNVNRENLTDDETPDPREKDLLDCAVQSLISSCNLSSCLSGSTYEANDPCEDKFSSLVNVLIVPINEETCERYGEKNIDKEEEISLVSKGSNDVIERRKRKRDDITDKFRPPIIRLSLFTVLDGHGGHSVSQHASETLLPLLSHNISETLKCRIIHKGDFDVNGIRKKSIKQNVKLEKGWYKTPIDVCTTPKKINENDGTILLKESKEIDRHILESTAESLLPQSESSQHEDQLKTGSHLPQEIEAISSTISQTFCEFDESLMNRIDRTKKSQTCCVSNGQWNVGSCCIVTLLVQRFEYNKDLMKYVAACVSDEEDTGAMMYTAHVGDCRAILLGATTEIDEISDDEELAGDNTLNEEENDDSSVETDVQCNNKDEYDIGGDCHEVEKENETFRNRTLESVSSVLSDLDNGSAPLLEKERIEGIQDNGYNIAIKSIPNPTERLSVNQMSCQVRHSPLSLPHPLYASTLTADHTPYNTKEATLVRNRTNNAPSAILKRGKSGIHRVGGSLSVTRALGNAFLKTRSLSFPPYEKDVPFITAQPSVSSRKLKRGDRILVIGSDGIWENVGKKMIIKWVEKFYSKMYCDPSLLPLFINQMGEHTKQNHQNSPTFFEHTENGQSYFSSFSNRQKRSIYPMDLESLCQSRIDSKSDKKKTKKDNCCNAYLLPTQSRQSRSATSNVLCKSQISNVIIRKVLNKVARSYKMKTLSSLMAIPKGRERRMIHDDITACVVDLSGFVS